MRVRYEASRYPARSVDGGGGEYLRDGQEYAVIEVGLDPHRRVWFRIENDHGTPALYDSRGFAEVDGSLPGNWHVSLADSGSITFGPAAFLIAGFWEKYFDAVPEAVEQYRAIQT
jgi:hypothetical protein